MSGRIRTIKPELLEDEKTARLGHLEFRVFIAIILMADDYGNLRGEPGFVRGYGLWGVPLAPEEVALAMDDLAERSLIEPYDVRGQRYIHICGWSKHQRVDKPGKPRVPGPDDPEVAAPREWHTYFVQLGPCGPIKIGKAVDIDARLATLQTTSPAPLVLLASTTSNVENACHRHFSHLRTHGEWFTPNSHLLGYVRHVANGGDPHKFPKELNKNPIANHSAPPEAPGENHSRMIREPFAPDPDLRPPTSDPDPDPGAAPGPPGGFSFHDVSVWHEATDLWWGLMADRKMSFTRKRGAGGDISGVVELLRPTSMKHLKAMLTALADEFASKAVTSLLTGGSSPRGLADWIDKGRKNMHAPLSGARGALRVVEPPPPRYLDVENLT